MFKTVWAKGLGLVVATAIGMLIGGVALAGLGGHNALAQNGSTGQAASTIVASVSAGDANASPVSATGPTVDVTMPATLKDRIIDMMKDHMGLSDQQANDWAQAMAEHMQAVHGDLSGPTLDQMYQYMDQYGYGYGMMNGINPGTSATPGTMMNGVTPGSMMGGTYTQSPSSVTPGTMMGWTTTTTGGTTAPSTPATQGPGTMMGGTSTTTGGTPTTSGATSQATTTPQTYVTPGTMMGGTQVTPVTPAGTSGSMMNGATSGGMVGGSAGGTTRTR